MIDFDCYKIPYDTTGYFSKLVCDYLNQSPVLREFYEHEPTIEGIKASINARRNFNTPRKLLVDCLKEQYVGVEQSDKLKQNILLLENENTFTITTAHQPNIFTGPLYFIYKILHAIRLADYLSDALPEFKFVPVYYMGSEDADLDELGSIHLAGKNLVWDTKQTGAVGRMLVDQKFLTLIHEIEGQIGVLEFGKELVQLFRACYTLGKSVQQATLELVNQLFSAYGLVVLIPDSAKLKSAYASVIKKELVEKFSHRLVTETIDTLKENYKVQTAGRALNLFYLFEHNRARIEFENDLYEVKELGLSFTQEEILNELACYPDRFSANVILRGGFQETVLPNIAFIGGGGELAYWMELRKVFQEVQIPYPVLILRNSFLFITQEQFGKFMDMGFAPPQIFQKEFDLLNEYVQRASDASWNITDEISAFQKLFDQVLSKANTVDKSLKDHVLALAKQSRKKMVALEKKILKAERKKFEASARQLAKLKNELFPFNSLQERTYNFSEFYSSMQKDFMQLIYENSLSLEMQFCIVVTK